MTPPRWLAEESRFWTVAALALGLVAALKGLRLPITWTATQAQLSYAHGFVKRGLLGEALTTLGLDPARYAVFAAVSALLLALLLGLLAALVWANRPLRRIGDGRVVALFGSGFALTYLVNSIGYLDIPLLILALAVVSLPHDRLRLPAALAAGVVGVLVHEMYVLVFFPLTLLPTLLDAAAARTPWPRLAGAGAVALAVAGIAALVALQPSLTAEQAAHLQREIAARADFPVRPDAIEVLTRSAADNLRIMGGLWSKDYWWEGQLFAAAAFLPTAAVFLWLALRMTGGAVRLCVAGAGLSPLLMQILGWDLYRWYALATVNCFMVLLIVARRRPEDEAPRLGAAARNALVLLIALNMATTAQLWDRKPAELFPFVAHYYALRHHLETGTLQPPPFPFR